MNTTQAINTILSSTQPHIGKVCRVTMVNGETRYVDHWDACAGVAVRLYMVDNCGRDCGHIKVDHNNLTDYITHVGNEKVI